MDIAERIPGFWSAISHIEWTLLAKQKQDNVAKSVGFPSKITMPGMLRSNPTGGAGFLSAARVEFQRVCLNDKSLNNSFVSVPELI
jgi:hypothetical protein